MLEEAEQSLAQSEADERLRGDALPETRASTPVYAPAEEDSTPTEAEEAPVPVFETEKKTNKILKCRDKSGAVSYTQGYCPSGTTLVDTPKFE
jgi:hypothetical protein